MFSLQCVLREVYCVPDCMSHGALCMHADVMMPAALRIDEKGACVVTPAPEARSSDLSSMSSVKDDLMCFVW